MNTMLGSFYFHKSSSNKIEGELSELKTYSDSGSPGQAGERVYKVSATKLSEDSENPSGLNEFVGRYKSEVVYGGFGIFNIIASKTERKFVIKFDNGKKKGEGFTSEDGKQLIGAYWGDS